MNSVERIRNGFAKLRWGQKAVGTAATLQGILSWLKFALLRPTMGEVGVASGFVLEFRYPSQFPAALVLFGDLIDPEYAFLRQVSRPHWIVADVGAAIGQFTIFAAKLPCSVVHAFEPSSTNVAMLQRNVERNQVTRQVQVHQLALSNVDGTSRFVTTGHTWVSQLRPGVEQEGEIVSVRRLSGEFQRLGAERLQVLKVNVAGFEPEVLEGTIPLFREGRIDILILLLGLRSLSWYATIAGYGYRFFYYHPLQQSLYEVLRFDEASVLNHRPWPARHIIAIHASALNGELIGSIAIRKLQSGQGQ